MLDGLNGHKLDADAVAAQRSGIYRAAQVRARMAAMEAPAASDPAGTALALMASDERGCLVRVALSLTDIVALMKHAPWGEVQP